MCFLNNTTLKNLFSQLLHGPFLLAKWAAIILLDPETHTTLMKAVITFAPDDHAVLGTSGIDLRLGLAGRGDGRGLLEVAAARCAVHRVLRLRRQENPG